MAIVPLLALVAFLALGARETSISDRLTHIGLGRGSIIAVLLSCGSVELGRVRDEAR